MLFRSQERGEGGSPAASHSAFTPHPIQGWTPDFIPKLAEDAVEASYIDEIIKIPGPEAMRCSRELAAREGIFIGVSGGATFAGALDICKDLPAGSTVLCMLPDTGERYLSTPLFENVEAEMNEEEKALSDSTPTARYED